jgi:N-acetylmuramoyl-L-alanine amidase
MKKKVKIVIFLLIIILLNINICFAEENINKESTNITAIRLGENKIVFDIEGDKIPSKIVTYDPSSRMLFIEFSNSIFKGKAENIKLFGDYVEKIESTSFDDNVDFFITLKKDTEFIESSLTAPTRHLITFDRKQDKKKFTVVLDAGHGGKDSGAVGYNGYREKDVNLAVTKLINEKLKDEFNTIMTRDDDVFIELAERAEIGNRAKTDLFISVHANAINKPSTRGIEVFYYSKKESAYAKAIAAYENSVDEKFGITKDYTEFIVNDIFYHINQEKSAKLASVTLENMLSATGAVRRRVDGANFAVLRGSKSPSILIELGFMTNKEECLNMVDPLYQEMLAEAIAKAIRKYFE